MTNKSTTQPRPSESPLTTAAKAVGSAAGKLAAMVGVAPPASPSVATEATNQRKRKPRLPRRKKKAERRAHGGSSPR